MSAQNTLASLKDALDSTPDSTLEESSQRFLRDAPNGLATERATARARRVIARVPANSGLTQEEGDLFQGLLGRIPNALEWDLVAAMWSEHCSYKSSRALLGQMPSEGSRVVGGAGENAGALRIGKDSQNRDYALVFKMESHNHPSMIAPREGAATGVGGIMRDIFTMGARPLANLNALRFGSFSDVRTRELVRGVVEGIAFYGNCTGIPTVGGECDFDEDYNDNILVNAMTVGLARTENLFSSRAQGIGNLVVYLGARTGRDGIDGARMASRAFSQKSSLEESKPQVQVGDPFAEKRLFEGCLEAMDKRLLLAVQDMGAAGLLSSSCEMAAKGGIGMRLDLEKVPLRQADLSLAEIMLSESQERMLAVVEEKSLAALRAIFAEQRLDCCVIGSLQEGDNLELFFSGAKKASISAALLSTQAPLLRREQKVRAKGEAKGLDTRRAKARLATTSNSVATLDALRRLLLTPRLACKSWITQQYDSLIGGQTVRGAGGEAALLRIEQTGELLAITSDSTPRYCRNDARLGAMQAVCEAWRNLTAVGATPLAITDNLNFGNPEDPYVMGDAACTVAGIAEACRFFGLPVVSGNVSFYNETAGRSIPPTPVIGALGIIEAAGVGGKNGLKNRLKDGLMDGLPVCTRDFAKSSASADEKQLFLLGCSANDGAEDELGASLYAQEILGEREGAPPAVDLAREKRHGDFLREAIASELCYYAHDLSCGGLLVKAALLAMRKGGNRNGDNGYSCGIDFTATNSESAFWFGESQARYLLCLNERQAAMLGSRARARKIPFRLIGRFTERGLLRLASGESVSTEQLASEWRARLPHYMDNRKATGATAGAGL